MGSITAFLKGLQRLQGPRLSACRAEVRQFFSGCAGRAIPADGIHIRTSDRTGTITECIGVHGLDHPEGQASLTTTTTDPRLGAH